jgi:tetratricopeptide (TPR) repeat protein
MFEKYGGYRWVICTVFVAVLVVVCAVYPASDPDLYIMLATGRYVAQTGHAPTVDLWSHTVYGRPWQMHEWFSSLIFYGLFSLWGINAIILLKAIMLTAAFILAVFTMKLKGVSPNVALVASVLALLAANYGFGERIQIFVFLFLVFLIFWVEMYRQSKISYPAFLGVTLFLMILWANIHMTHVFGVFILGLYFADDVISVFKKKEWRKLYQPAITFFTSFAAIGLNPYGFHNVILTLTYYFKPDLQKLDAQIYSGIMEYQPMLSPGFSREPLVIYGLIWIGFSLVGIALGWRKVKFSFSILWVLFTYWAIGYIRFLWLQVFITVIGVGFHWQAAVDSVFFRFKNIKNHLLGNLAFIVLLIVILSGAMIYKRSGKYLWQRFELGWKPRMYSDQAVDFLKDHMDGGKLFNDFDIGGYLLWKEIPVFVDGRIGPYFGTNVIQDHFRISGGELKLLDRYGIDWLLLPYAKTSQSEDFDRFNRKITATGDWSLVYWDDVCLIYVRKTEKYKGLVAKYGYNHVNPAVPDLSIDFKLFFDELKRKVSEDPSGLMPHILAGNYFFEKGDPRMAEKEFKLVLEKDPFNATMYNNLGNAYLRQGRVDMAIESYKRATELDVNLGLAYCNWGYLMEAKGDTKQAVKLYSISIKVAPSDAWPYNRLGLIEMKLGNRDKAYQYWKKGAALDPSSEAAKNLVIHFKTYR